MAAATWIAHRVLRGRPLHPAVAFLVGLVFGAWHEGFSVPVLAGQLALSLFFPSRFRRAYIWALEGGMVLGIAWLACCPAFLSRGSDGAALLVAHNLLQALRYDFLIGIYALLWAAALMRPRTRSRALEPLHVFIFSCCAVSYLISAYALFGMRVGMCGEMFAIVGILRLWGARRCRLAKAVTIAVGAFLIAHLAVASVMTVRTNRSFDALYEQYRRSPDGRVFTDITPDFRAPFLALGKPLFLHQEKLVCEHLVKPLVFKPLLPVPERLADIGAHSGKPVAGKPGLRELDGFYFISADSLELPRDRWTDAWGRVTFGTAPHMRPLRAIPFTSRADGCDYFYIYVSERMPRERFGPIKAIDW